MLKNSLLLLFLCLCLSAIAQGPPGQPGGSFTKPNNSRGIRYNGLWAEKELYVPVTDTGWTPLQIGAVVKLASDSLNGTYYTYSKAGWKPISGGGGTTYSAGYGLVLNSTTFRVDTFNIATRLRLYKVGDSLNALNTLGTVVTRGNTATAINIVDVNTAHTPIAIQGHSAQTWNFLISNEAAQPVFGVSSGSVYSLPLISSVGGVAGNMFKNFGNYNSNLEMLFNERGGVNNDSTGYWRVVDNQGGVEMIRAQVGKVYLPTLAPTTGNRYVIVKSTGALDTSGIAGSITVPTSDTNHILFSVGGVPTIMPGFWIANSIFHLPFGYEAEGNSFAGNIFRTYTDPSLGDRSTRMVSTNYLYANNYTRAQVDSAITANALVGAMMLAGTQTTTGNKTANGTWTFTNTTIVPANSVGTNNTQAATTALVKYSIDSTVLQIHLTSVSGTYHIPNSIATWIDLFVDPASVSASFELYLPTSGRVNQHVKVWFGEHSRIPNGDPVISEFNAYNSDGTAVTGLDVYPAAVVTGDGILFTRNSFTNKWHGK